MKLRIRGNSIRLRLLRSEIAQLAVTGTICENINFGQQKLIYTLRASSEAKEISANFTGGEITILLPDSLARNWVESEQIGLEAKQRVSESEDLKILIEKDFVCLDRPDDADNRDAFPHPSQKC